MMDVCEAFKTLDEFIKNHTMAKFDEAFMPFQYLLNKTADSLGVSGAELFMAWMDNNCKK